MSKSKKLTRTPTDVEQAIKTSYVRTGKNGRLDFYQTWDDENVFIVFADNVPFCRMICNESEQKDC